MRRPEGRSRKSSATGGCACCADMAPTNNLKATVMVSIGLMCNAQMLIQAHTLSQGRGDSAVKQPQPCGDRGHEQNPARSARCRPRVGILAGACRLSAEGRLTPDGKDRSAGQNLLPPKSATERLKPVREFVHAR